ncbi:RICIN domain-containing protein, partial [Nocardioides sp. GCM10030258]
VLTGRCFDAYGSDLGGQVGTWGCGAQDNQRWRVLANPAGGVSLRLVRGGLCLGVAHREVGTGLTMQSCTLGSGVRWRIAT